MTNNGFIWVVVLIGFVTMGITRSEAIKEVKDLKADVVRIQECVNDIDKGERTFEQCQWLINEIAHVRR